MTEPITVTDALKALRMLKEVGEKATPGPWQLLPPLTPHHLPIVSRALYAPRRSPEDPTFYLYGCSEQARSDDGAFAVAARAVLPGMVEYLRDKLVYETEGGREFVIATNTCPMLYAAIAPIVAWAKTREEWSR